MADHDELVAEMLALEQMGTQERQKLAKKRRMQQLKKWGQREKEWLAKEKQLNRRLANILNEENNGLNLKQYTTYNSNQRQAKKPRTPTSNTTTTATTNKKTNTTTANANTTTTTNGGANRYNSNSNNSNGSNGVSKGSPLLPVVVANGDKVPSNIMINNNNNNNLTSTIDAGGPYAKNLTPNGRVHFDVGVMLLEAAARNDYDEVKRLLTLGVSPDSVNHDGLTALHQCCIDASEPIMQLLLEFGADVDARDTERWTPLHAACTCGHLNLVRILVAHEANLLAVNGDGNMPFDICEDEATLDYIESQMIKRGITQEMIDTMRASSEIQMHQELEQLLAGGGGGGGGKNSDTVEAQQIDLNGADADGVTRLHIAAANNYLSVVKLLLQHGANANVCDNDLWRPLHGVACWGNEQHTRVAEMLVVEGCADLDAKTSSDETAFDLCDNPELLERLNQLKDELESKRGSGQDRLRRTQSRTNSRVHSVRRTRVQDKNQISRREAREEALLRVESSENLNGGGATSVVSPAAASRGELALDSSSGSNQSESQSAGVAAAVMPSETDLDLISQPEVVNGLDQVDQVDQVDSLPAETSLPAAVEPATQQTTRSQPAANEPAGQMASGFRDNERPPAAKLSSTSSSITTMRVVSPSAVVSPRKVNSEILNGTAAASERSPPQGTSIVQVHFTAPMNYTLANLKKHRSEVRMRTAVIGGGGNSSSSLLGSNSSSVQLEPEPHLVLREAPVDSTTLPTSNGWTPSPIGVTSGALSFNKFHGEPSDAIEYRQGRYKCCAII